MSMKHRLNSVLKIKDDDDVETVIYRKFVIHV